jgi:hypothetical protein
VNRAEVVQKMSERGQALTGDSSAAETGVEERVVGAQKVLMFIV